jgi:hypothetical protein
MHFARRTIRHALVALLCVAAPLRGAPVDEAQVPPYTLPDPLVMADGAQVVTTNEWLSKRRPELRELAAREMYGCAPPRPERMTFQVLDQDPLALGGKATRKQVAVLFAGDPAGPRMELLIYIPKTPQQPTPAILGFNFWGNQAVNADPGIRLTQNWLESGANPYVDLSGVKDHRATDACRGVNARQWPIETFLARGYTLVTAYRGDIFTDSPTEAFQSGVLAAYPELQGRGDNFSGIGAWAWALSRALDYLETEPTIDAKRVAVFGWSRLGKAALWAGASDERFAAVISHQSGAGGAALSKRVFGEDVERLNRAFPHWFCRNFRQYSNRETALPFDQHEVIALVAPRPVCIGSGMADLHADPHGEFLAAKAAEPVYRLFGKAGLATGDWPQVNHSLAGSIGYHLRPGGHDVTADDWTAYLEYLDNHLIHSSNDRAAVSPGQ